MTPVFVLTLLLANPDFSVREWASAALCGLGPSALVEVRVAGRSRDAEVAVRAREIMRVWCLKHRAEEVTDDWRLLSGDSEGLGNLPADMRVPIAGLIWALRNRDAEAAARYGLSALQWVVLMERLENCSAAPGDCDVWVDPPSPYITVEGTGLRIDLNHGGPFYMHLFLRYEPETGMVTAAKVW